MSFSEFFPVYDKLSARDQERLNSLAMLRKVPQGTVVHNGGADCLGLLVIRSGQLRSYISSDEGREITIYRLFERDICLFSASCIMQNIQFDITISAEKDTEFWVIPPAFYRELMANYVEVANYTNDLMATRFTELMWLVEQIMWKSFDKRLAKFLLDEYYLEGEPESLKITHEIIAGHLGTAREVVTRMLKYFQTEGMVRLTRGSIQIIDEVRLSDLVEE